MKKNIASLVATLLIFATAQLSFAQSGTFGELSWRIANNTLTIGVTADTGSAPMNDGWTPWSRYADSSISTIIIEDRVTTIAAQAFVNFTELTAVTIPSSVTTIGIAAFQNSPNLESVISLNPTPPMLGSNVFLGIPNDACVFVPESSLNAYQTADGWSEFLCLQALSFHTVTFNSQGGSDVESQTVEHGETAEQPINPRRRNHTFEGWYIDTRFTTAWDFATDVVTSDTTLFAKWTFDGATNIVETHEPASLQAFPNPFINEIHIADAEDFSLQVLTQTGVIAHTQQITKPLEIVNLQGLQAGIYILRLEKNGEVRTARIVKQ